MATPCPSCRGAMVAQRFARKLGGEVEIDLCFACQGIWFDDFESAQLAPAGVVDLFKAIHAHRDETRHPLAEPLFCPRCDEPLKHGMDRVKSGVFNYHRCLQQHGRFTSFAQFMTEKGFVRQLTGLELDALKAGIGTIRCNGCGAPVDIRRDAACAHCRSPLVVLDPQAVEKALAGYHAAEARQTVPADPNALAEAIIGQHRAKKRSNSNNIEAGVELGDLLLGGIDLLWSVLKR